MIRSRKHLEKTDPPYKARGSGVEPE